MKIFGLIGFPLSHSFSPNYFRTKFITDNIQNCEYLSFPIESIKLFPSLLLNNPNLKGLNVTIPYKEAIIPYLTALDVTAQEIGAVNTIIIDKNNNKLIGYNTDAYGFENSLNPLISGIKNLKALILGTGGASKAIEYVLKKRNIDYKIVSRNSAYNTLKYTDLDAEIIKNHFLIINATPLGMVPNVENSPDIPYHFLTNNHILYDLIYNPERTKFLDIGSGFGAKIKNGLEMLHLQANKSWEIWNN